MSGTISDPTVRVSEGWGEASLNFSFDASEPALAGYDLGRYRVLEELGKGAFGSVLRAHDPELGRDVALKLLRGLFESGDESSLPFRREARALAQLSHPNVVQVYEVGEHRGQTYIAMELVEGVTLREWRKQSRGWREVIAMFLAIGQGLAAAHKQGLVHRDFKPDNVMVGKDGRARVLDFGLVRSSAVVELPDFDLERGASEASNPLSLELTMAGSRMGTPAYMSPEQHRGDEADARSDQFSFGVALFEALYGVRPFAGPGIKELKEQCLAGEIIEVDARDLPPWVARIVRRALSTQREERFESHDDMLAALADDPSAKRRKLTMGLAVAASLCLGVWGLTRPQQIDDPCPRDPSLSGVWTPERAATLEAGFKSTGLGFGVESWTQAETNLELFASRLADAQVHVCRDSQDATTAATHQVQCQRKASRDFERAIERLESVREDPTVVFRSSQILGTVSDPKDCLDPERAGALSDTLPDNLEHDTLLEILEAISVDTEAPDAIERAQRAVERAKELEAAGLLARAERVLAQSLHAAERNGDALEIISRSMWDSVALEKPRQAFNAVLLHANLVTGQSQSKQDFKSLIQLAESLLERSGRHPVDEAQLHLVRGHRHRVELRADEALTAFRRGLALDFDKPRVELPLRQGETDALIRLGRLEEAVEAARANHKRAVAVLGSGHPATLHYQEQIGLAQARWGRTEAAIETYEAASRRSLDSLGRLSENYALLRLNLSTVLSEAGRHEEAAPQLAEAIEVLEQLGPDQWGHRANAYNNLAVNLDRLGKYAEARLEVTKALEIMKRERGASHPLVGVLIITQADIERHAGELDTALALYEEASKLFAGAVSERDKLYADLHHGHGAALVAKGQWGVGRERLELALAIRIERGDYPSALARTHAALARAWKAEDSQEAEKATRAALEAYAKTSNRHAETEFRNWAASALPRLKL